MVRGFQNAGAQGIVSVKGMEDISVEALGKLKSEFYTESSGTLNARKNLFMGNEVTFTQIGLSPVDMQVIESQKYTFKRICNAYGVSDVLFNNGEAATESNVNAMIKRLYTNAALPEVYAYRDLLNQSIVPLFGPDYYVDVDLVGITELQDDMKAMADIFSTLPIMQPNMILEAFNYGKSDDIMMDQFYIKAGYEPIANMAPIPDLPISPDYGQPATNR
jgi:HK97 family phage portal protein